MAESGAVWLAENIPTGAATLAGAKEDVKRRILVTRISESDWQARLNQAEALAEAGTECPLCGGTGG